MAMVLISNPKVGQILEGLLESVDEVVLIHLSNTLDFPALYSPLTNRNRNKYTLMTLKPSYSIKILNSPCLIFSFLIIVANPI